MSKNILALDVGGRRIGIARASLAARLATPLETIDTKIEKDIFNRLRALVKDHDVDTIVVGLPRGLEGQETNQTALARQFADELKKQLDIEVFLQDEAATSLIADNELKLKGKKYQKADIDALAATIILEDWLYQTTRERQ